MLLAYWSIELSIFRLSAKAFLSSADVIYRFGSTLRGTFAFAFVFIFSFTFTFAFPLTFKSAVGAVSSPTPVLTGGSVLLALPLAFVLVLFGSRLGDHTVMIP